MSTVSSPTSGSSGSDTAVADVAVVVTDVQYLLPADIWRQIFCFLGNVPDLLHLEQTCRRFLHLLEEDDVNDDYDNDGLWIGYRRVMNGGQIVLENNNDNNNENNSSANDDFWKICTGASTHHTPQFTDMTSYRARACLYNAGELIYKEQRKTDNIIVSELGERLWVELIHSLVQHTLGWPLFGVRDSRNGDDKYVFKICGDASVVLVEILQQVMIKMLQDTNLTMVGHLNTHGPEPYPVLGYKDLVVTAAVKLGHNGHNGPHSSWSMAQLIKSMLHVPGDKTLFPLTEPPEFTALVKDLFHEFRDKDLTMARVGKMIRRLGRRAGVVKMSKAATMKVWKGMVYAIMVILVPACQNSVILRDYDDDEIKIYNKLAATKHQGPGSFKTTIINNRVKLHSHESSRNVPPLPCLTTTTMPGYNRPIFIISRIREFVLVPGQVEASASHLPNANPQVLETNGWHVIDPASTRAQEKKQARAMYEFLPPPPIDYVAVDENGKQQQQQFEWDLDDINGNAEAAALLLEVSDDDDTVSWVPSSSSSDDDETTENDNDDDDDDIVANNDGDDDDRPLVAENEASDDVDNHVSLSQAAPVATAAAATDETENHGRHNDDDDGDDPVVSSDEEEAAKRKCCHCCIS